jgi:hypothetical protein
MTRRTLSAGLSAIVRQEGRMGTKPGRYREPVERFCKACGEAFDAYTSAEGYCGDPCRIKAGRARLVPTRVLGRPVGERKKWLEVLTVCPIRDCEVEGPRARLPEHLLYDHHEDPDAWLTR